MFKVSNKATKTTTIGKEIKKHFEKNLICKSSVFKLGKIYYVFKKFGSFFQIIS